MLEIGLDDLRLNRFMFMGVVADVIKVVEVAIVILSDHFGLHLVVLAVSSSLVFKRRTQQCFGSAIYYVGA